jgi:UDP-2,3-diacylglucosamine pyrophosphatase LpxH
MSDIAYVCLSDMHFGAASSLLTNLDYVTLEVAPGDAPPVLEALVDCLAAVVQRHPKPKPVLVLNGDIFELALAHDSAAAMAFERFVELTFKTGPRLFDRVIYIPGNHDHHLWETARETVYAQYITDRDPAEELEPPWHTTRLRDDVPRNQPVRSPMLRAIFARQGIHDVEVEVRYPNYGVLRDGGRRAVVFHHGHFVEPIYTAMTAMQRVIFPTSEKGPEVADWEARNFAWIDFLWSTLGRSGDAGEDVGLIYDMLEDRDAVKAIADNILDDALPRVLKGWKRRLRRPAHWFIRKQILDSVTKFERRNPTETLSASSREGLRRYLEGPLAAQILYENRDLDDMDSRHMPDETTFVFGHTHKPFQHHESFDRYPRGVALYNSGGWVVDTTTPDARQGASVILVDDDLHTASVHLYQQTPGGPIAPAKVEVIDPRTSPIAAELATKVHGGDLPWKALTTAISDELPRRREALQRLINNGKITLSGAELASEGPATPQSEAHEVQRTFG